MGVLHDYFRAPDAATAIEWAVGPGGDWRRREGGRLDEYSADWLDCKGLDPIVVLGKLVAFAQGVRSVAGGPSLVWPNERDWPYGVARIGQDSLWDSGLILERLPDAWTATLAGVGDEHLDLLALQWMEIEEVSFADFAAAHEAAADFCGLARRSAEHGDQIFCMTVV